MISPCPSLLRRLAPLRFAPALLVALCAVAPPAPAQDWARQRLDASPRHREWVQIPTGVGRGSLSGSGQGAPGPHNGSVSRTVQTFVVYPETAAKAPVIVLIHEIFGLSDWAREMADELAAEGYIVVAPDLLSGEGPNGGGSSEFPSIDATTKAVSMLDPSQVTSDLQAAADFGRKLPASNGKLAVVGFCWGGGKAFSLATTRNDLGAAFVFYGPPPDTAAMSSIVAPVFGFYAGNDARIDATIPATVEAMKKASKRYEPVTYAGAGHGFMRAGEAPDATPENKKAREEAFVRLKAELTKLR